MNARSRMTFRLIDRLNGFAKANGTNATAVVRRACEQYLAVNATRTVHLPTREETTREDSHSLRLADLPNGIDSTSISQIVTWYMDNNKEARK